MQSDEGAALLLPLHQQQGLFTALQSSAFLRRAVRLRPPTQGTNLVIVSVEWCPT